MVFTNNNAAARLALGVGTLLVVLLSGSLFLALAPKETETRRMTEEKRHAHFHELFTINVKSPADLAASQETAGTVATVKSPADLVVPEETGDTEDNGDTEDSGKDGKSGDSGGHRTPTNDVFGGKSGATGDSGGETGETEESEESEDTRGDYDYDYPSAASTELSNSKLPGTDPFRATDAEQNSWLRYTGILILMLTILCYVTMMYLGNSRTTIQETTKDTVVSGQLHSSQIMIHKNSYDGCLEAILEE